jgi:hypothetical protein
VSGSLFGCWAVAAGCRRRSPEQQVRDTIAALASAIEDKDLKAIGKLVSERYQDGERQDRAALLELLSMTFARTPEIHLLTRITAIEIAPSPGQPARATVLAAIASLPMKRFEDAARLQVDTLRFELTFGEEGRARWVVTGASWQVAGTPD